MRVQLNVAALLQHLTSLFANTALNSCSWYDIYIKCAVYIYIYVCVLHIFPRFTVSVQGDASLVYVYIPHILRWLLCSYILIDLRLCTIFLSGTHRKLMQVCGFVKSDVLFYWTFFLGVRQVGLERETHKLSSTECTYSFFFIAHNTRLSC